MSISAFLIVLLIVGFVEGFSVSLLPLLIQLAHQLLELLLELVGLLLQVLVQELSIRRQLDFVDFLLLSIHDPETLWTLLILIFLLLLSNGYIHQRGSLDLYFLLLSGTGLLQATL